MNKFKKISLAILGGTNAVFGMFIPIAIGLVILSLYKLSYFSEIVITITSVMSTLYRAIRIGMSD